MARKTFLIVLLLALTALLTGCGGGGSGNSSGPVGVNPNVPAVVQMLPVQYVAQTNSFITFKAKVLNGNGNVLPGVSVVFTKMSLLGVLSATHAFTDTLGFATVTVSSTTPGFTTVQAEVNTGTGLVRDRRTVLFTTGSLNISPFIVMNVDGDNDFKFDEPGDFILFENANDNTVNIMATVFSGIGLPMAGVTVQFGTDAPFRVGSDPSASCSDGSTSCEVAFPLGNIATTDAFGQAFAIIQVNPVTLRNVSTILNVTAQELFSGAYNVLSLFLNPVTIQSVQIFPPTATVAGKGTIGFTASATTTAGNFAPVGTAMSFSSTGGTLSPYFSQIDDTGTATTTFTAGATTTGGSGSVTATVGGKHATASITITPGT